VPDEAASNSSGGYNLRRGFSAMGPALKKFLDKKQPEEQARLRWRFARNSKEVKKMSKKKRAKFARELGQCKHKKK
jgi:hypothetical protein